MDFEMKIKLIEMARYLGDDNCISRILKQETLLMRFLILKRMDLIEPLHVAIASCFAINSSYMVTYLSENEVESILNQSEISSLAKKKICKAFEKKFLKYPNSIIFNSTILHVTLSAKNKKKRLNFNNQQITFSLQYCEEDKKSIINVGLSRNLEFFGSNVKFYIQLTINKVERLGIWLEKCDLKNSTLFKLPQLPENSMIDLIVIP